MDNDFAAVIPLFVAGICAFVILWHFFALCGRVKDIHDKLFDDKNDSSTNNKR